MTNRRDEGWPGVANAVRDWWQSLQPQRPDGERNPMADRGALARLRRAASLAEAMAEEATLDLWRRLPGDLRERRRLPRVALIAHVLAHVREDDGRPAIAAVGRARADDEDSAALKPIRFRRLLAAREDEELMREMRRLVALAERRINVGDLGASLLFWSDAVRARWAFDYFAAGAAAPGVTAVAAAAPSEPATLGTA